MPAGNLSPEPAPSHTAWYRPFGNVPSANTAISRPWTSRRLSRTRDCRATVNSTRNDPAEGFGDTDVSPNAVTGAPATPATGPKTARDPEVVLATSRYQ